MTDPREEKLQRIIEEGRASVTKSLQEIQNEFTNRVDLMVKPHAVDFTVKRGAIWPFIDFAEHQLNNHSTSQVLARAIGWMLGLWLIQRLVVSWIIGMF